MPTWEGIRAERAESRFALTRASRVDVNNDGEPIRQRGADLYTGSRWAMECCDGGYLRAELLTE